MEFTNAPGSWQESPFATAACLSSLPVCDLPSRMWAFIGSETPPSPNAHSIASAIVDPSNTTRGATVNQTCKQKRHASSLPRRRHPPAPPSPAAAPTPSLPPPPCRCSAAPAPQPAGHDRAGALVALRGSGRQRRGTKPTSTAATRPGLPAYRATKAGTCSSGERNKLRQAVLESHAFNLSPNSTLPLKPTGSLPTCPLIT